MWIPYGVQHLTGITDEMVESAPCFEDVAAQVAERFAGRLFVAHNARFDYGFLREEFRRAGITFESRVACTVKLSRKVNPTLPRHNLDTLSAYLGFQITRRHRALPDAQALWQFWCDLRARPQRDEIEKALERVTRVKQRKSQLRRVPDVAADVGTDAADAGADAADVDAVLARTPQDSADPAYADAFDDYVDDRSALS